MNFNNSCTRTGGGCTIEIKVCGPSELKHFVAQKSSFILNEIVVNKNRLHGSDLYFWEPKCPKKFSHETNNQLCVQ